MPKLIETLRKNVFSQLEVQNWSLADFARKLEWETSHVSLYFAKDPSREPRIPKLDTLEEIARALDKTVPWLLTDHSVKGSPGRYESLIREVLGLLAASDEDELMEVRTLIIHGREIRARSKGVQGAKKSSKGKE